jgi:DNA polymerase-3 subunit delta
VPKDTDAVFAILEKDVPPVVALGGEERVYLDDALELIRSKTLEGAMKDFNWDRVSARDRRANDIVSLASTLPVMARRRLVEVRDAEALSSDLEALERYLANPAKETVVVLLLGNVDMRDKLAKALDKAALLAKFEHPKERDMPRHVERRARRHKLKVGREAAEALAATVGADLTLLERALEKLAIACEGDVTVDDVERHVADTRLEDAFGFVRALAKGERPDALAALGRLQSAREEPLRLLGLIAWQLRQLVRARALMDDGRQGAIASELNLFGDRLTTTLAATKRLDARAHAWRLARTADVDVLLKGSRQPEWLVMTRLVDELCTHR